MKLCIILSFVKRHILLLFLFRFNLKYVIALLAAAFVMLWLKVNCRFYNEKCIFINMYILKRVESSRAMANNIAILKNDVFVFRKPPGYFRHLLWLWRHRHSTRMTRIHVHCYYESKREQIALNVKFDTQ